MGIIRKNRAGLSKEFHQLRDYHQGDSLNQIDWKSSARRQELISRDYQEQRDQTILLAIDSGSRMRSMEGDLSHFVRCLIKRTTHQRQVFLQGANRLDVFFGRVKFDAFLVSNLFLLFDEFFIFAF